jgi:hypothetical protein
MSEAGLVAAGTTARHASSGMKEIQKNDFIHPNFPQHGIVISCDFSAQVEQYIQKIHHVGCGV